MSRGDRLERIAAVLTVAGRAAVSELAELTEVSEMTVRRDLEELERQGRCRRVHGGAVLPPGRGGELDPDSRRARHVAARQRIGRHVAAGIVSGQSVLLDVGSTTLAVAEALADRRDLILITPSLELAVLLADRGDNQVICLGGQVRRGEHGVVGSLTEQALTSFHVDLCVLSAGGVSVHGGLTAHHPEGAEVKRRMMEQARRTVVVVDASKLGIATFAVVAPLSDVDQVVTSTHETSEQLLLLRAAGVDVVNLPPDGPGPNAGSEE